MTGLNFDQGLMALAATAALASTRFLGLFLTLPLLSFRSFALSLRIAPVLLLTWAAAPQVQLTPAQWQEIGMLSVVSEAAIGMVAGLSLRLAMLAVDFFAESLSMHAGFSFAQTVAPDVALPSTVLGELLGMSVLAALFAADVHLLFIERIAASFAAVPFGSWPSGWDLGALLALVGTAFSIGLVLSSGSFALYLLTHFMLALVNRISPQINLMSVGFSITAPLALLVLGLVALQLPLLSELLGTTALDFVARGLSHAR